MLGRDSGLAPSGVPPAFRCCRPSNHTPAVPPCPSSHRTIATQKNIEIDLNRLHWTPYRTDRQQDTKK